MVYWIMEHRVNVSKGFAFIYILTFYHESGQFSLITIIIEYYS